MGLIHPSSRRFSRTTSYNLPQGRYANPRPRKRVELVPPTGRTSPADRRR